VFNCLTGFYKPTVGMITMRRRNGEAFLLERLPDDSINKVAGVARTFQNIRLFAGMTCLENLLVAQHHKLMAASGFTIGGVIGLKSYRDAEKAAIDKATFWLERVGLIERADDAAGDLPMAPNAGSRLHAPCALIPNFCVSTNRQPVSTRVKAPN
jgi:branched-chain amino acid transport system ATP-binding protein